MWKLCVLDKFWTRKVFQSFENCILKTYFLTPDLFMQPIGSILTSLVGDHLWIIGQIDISGLGKEVVRSYIIQCKILIS